MDKGEFLPNMGVSGVKLTVFFFVCGWALGKASFGAIPIRWAPSLALEGSGQIAEKIKDKLVPEGEPGLSLFFNGMSRYVSTCEQYLQFRDEGFDAVKPTDIAEEMFFRFRCKTLQWLGRAQPSRSSTLDGYLFSDTTLDELPPCLGMPEEGDTETKVQEAMIRGLSLKEFDPAIQITKITDYAISLNDGKQSLNLDLLAWADFNGDGPEDLLIFVNNSALKGTYRDYYHVVLTKTPGQKVFRVVNDDSRRCPIRP